MLKFYLSWQGLFECLLVLSGDSHLLYVSCMYRCVDMYMLTILLTVVYRVGTVVHTLSITDSRILPMCTYPGCSNVYLDTWVGRWVGGLPIG